MAITEDDTAIPRERLLRMVEVCDEIQSDMQADVKRHDGKALTGARVAEMHGELAATCSALAALVKVLVEERLS